MEKQDYIAVVCREADALAGAAERDLAAPVPSCPAWNVAGLVGHTGLVHRFVTRRVSQGSAEYVSLDLDDIELPDGARAWVEADFADRSVFPVRLLDWFRRGAEDLVAALQAADPDDPAWTWFDPEQRARFWQRRMAHETAVHRWDAESAHGNPQPIDAELARDGVDEALDIHVPDRIPDSKAEGRGETYHFHRTDGEGEWLVRLEGNGFEVCREHAKGDVAIRGTASDLMLFLWQRVGSDALEIHGDRALVDRWFELVPPA